MNLQTFVSVLMPLYNCENYVEKAIDSILNQTHHNFELLIADDGSKDNSVKKVKQYSDPRIRLVCFAKNKGNVEALNFLFKEARGEYITFQDADDFSADDRLEKQLRFLIDNPDIALCSTSYRMIGYDGCLEEPVKILLTKEALLEDIEVRHFPFICCATMFFRKHLIEEVGIYRTYFSHIGSADFDWFLRVIQKFDVANIPSVTYFYRKNLDSVTKTMSIDLRKKVSHEIAFFLYKERQKFIEDSIDSGDFNRLNQFLDVQFHSYRVDQSLIYREMGYHNARKGKFAGSLQNALVAIIKNPTKKENFSLLRYIIWKMRNRNSKDLANI